MHHIYHTDALIISAENAGEADRMYLLYTKDLGFIYAKAVGVRFEKSKLRFSLQPYTLARVALVRGKAIWRITTATPISLLFDAHAAGYFFETFQNITSVLKDLVPVEIADSRIFEDLRNAFLSMHASSMTILQVKDIELCLMLRVLHYLGYVAEEETYQNIFSTNFSFHTFPYTTLAKNEAIKTINSALFVSAR